MSDQIGQGSEATPAAQPRAVMACPRCRGTFAGDPEACPHCGLAKADTPTFLAGGPAAAAPPPAAPPMPPSPPTAASAAPAPGSPEPAEPGGASQSKRPRFLLLAAAAVALLTVLGAGWWVTKDGVEEDPCSAFREQMQQVQAQEHANSREERRAIAEVEGKAQDAGCDLDVPASEAAG